MQDSCPLPPLPPPLRVVRLLGCLFPLAALAVFGIAWVATQFFTRPLSSLDSTRLMVIGFNLTALGLACVSAVGTYRARTRQSDSQLPRRPFPLTSWQSRLRVIAVVAALSTGTLIVAVVLPPTAVAFVFVLPICNLVAMGVITATLWMNRER